VFGVTLSPDAAKHIRHQLHNRGKGIGIRVGAKTSGCTGMAYVLEFIDNSDSEYNVYTSYGVDVYVDRASLKYLAGTQIDLVVDGLNVSLGFTNPNMTSECGCGESFTTDT